MPLISINNKTTNDANMAALKDNSQSGGKNISLSGFFDPAFNGQTANIPAIPVKEQDGQSASKGDIVPQENLAQNTQAMEVKTEEKENASDQSSKESLALKDEPAQQNILSSKNKQTADNNAITSASGNLENADLGSLIQQDILSEKALEEVVKEGYIPKIVAAMINYALNKKVSDIHIEPQAKTLRIRCRVDGVLIDIAKANLVLHPPIVSRIKILSKLKIDETRIPQDGRFEVSFKNRAVDVRVSSLPTVHGEKMVLRILDKSQKILSLEDLGMQGSALDKTMQSMTRPWGVILSTGPTGSGKSTTLNAIINRLNLPGKNIVTLEDPVEYETPGVNQCQVKPDIGFTFASGLRSVLRQDPNIIMVGEIRDAETAGMATHAALTGHLVLSTLHTNDTAGSLPRLINMGVEPFLITSAVDLIIAQRLIRLVCPKCKEETKLPPKMVEEIKAELEKISPSNQKDRALIPKEMRFYHGRGCPECTAGFKGRIGIFEVMTMTPEIEDLAIAKRPANELKVAALKGGMITMKQDGIIKSLQGLTTIDEVYQATMES